MVHTLRRGMTVLMLLGLASALPAQDKAEDAKKKQAEMMAIYMKAATPGPRHKLLEPMIGQWNFTGRFWMDPSSPPTDTKGVTERKWILGGRFIADDVEAAEFAGEKFRGFGLTGYDNTQQKYIGVWLDSMGTGIGHSIGVADTAGKVFTYQNEHVDPITKQKVKGRDLVKIESNDKHTMEMYKTMPDGKEMKVGELTFTRKK